MDNAFSKNESARQDAEKDFAAAFRILAGRALLRRATLVMAEIGAIPVVLKGILLSALSEGSGRPPRPMLDVDVLVSSEARERLLPLLAQRGWTLRMRTETADTWIDPEYGFDLDLHSELSDRFLFRFYGRDVIQRARHDRALYGFEVLRPADEDVYAHLIAHFVRNRSNGRDRRRVADFKLAAELLDLNAALVAKHLVTSGLGRASRYALSLAAEQGDTFAMQVLSHLPRDPVGEWLSKGADLWLARHAGNAKFAAPIPHVLNCSLARGGFSFGSRAVGAAFQIAKNGLWTSTRHRTDQTL